MFLSIVLCVCVVVLCVCVLCGLMAMCLISTSVAHVHRCHKGQCRRLHGLFLFISFLCLLYWSLSFLSPLFSNHRLDSSLAPSTPIPPPSVCQCLDGNYSLLCVSLRAFNFSYSKRTKFLPHLLITLLLLLSSNVELNPGPVTTSCDLTFSCLNVRSAASVTDTLDKPVFFRSSYRTTLLISSV